VAVATQEAKERTALRDAVTTAFLWYLGPAGDGAWFAAYAATYPSDIEKGLHVLRSGGEQALDAYLEEI
jgi:hypothetical protein